jgi:micrococcal nuclease
MSNHSFLYPIKSFDTVDGDTLDLQIDLGFGITRKIRARISGIDCPETRLVRSRAAGRVSETAARLWMYRNGLENKRLWSQEIVKDKYGRVMGDIVHVACDGASITAGDSLSSYMFSSGYARLYNGGAKDEWEQEILEEIASRAISGGVYIDEGMFDANRERLL